MTIRSKITSLGLAPLVEEIIADQGLNKSNIHRRINQELELRGKPAITYATVSLYIDKWVEERNNEAAALISAYKSDDEIAGPEWSTDIVAAIIKNGDYSVEVAKGLSAAKAINTGLVDTMRFLSTVMMAGLAKVINDPDSVTLQDAIKAAQMYSDLSKGGVKTLLQQAIQVNVGDSQIQHLIDSADAVEGEFEVQ